MARRIVVKNEFRLQKLKKLIVVRNMDRTNNSSGEITNQVEVNVYYKNDMERMRMDMCDLERTDMILEILWLQVHNHEINWETGEVKITRCPPLYRREGKENKRMKREKG